MTVFLLRRALFAALLVVLVLTLLFVFLHLAPGEPSVFYDNPRLGEEQRRALAASLGLDRPLAEQYLRWMGAALRGDWGFSLRQGRPVSRVLAEALPATLLLTGTAVVLQYGFGVVLGVLAARRAGRWPDYLARFGTLVLYALPQFWLGLMALLVLGYRWQLFPTGQLQSFDAGQLAPLPYLAHRLHHLALPALVLAAGSCAAVARHMRNSMLDVLGQDHIRAARARGISERRVIWVHALRNSLTPLTQLAGLSLSFLLSGALVVEAVFSWPGMGRLTYLAIRSRDYPVILGATALTALLVIAGSLVADLAQAAVDPRVRDE